jgi:uncharacterized membrane-anchored protein YitT (DUF2179 family)
MINIALVIFGVAFFIILMSAFIFFDRLDAFMNRLAPTPHLVDPPPRFYWYQLIIVGVVLIPTLVYLITLCFSAHFYWPIVFYSLMMLIVIRKMLRLLRSALAK